MSETVEEYEDDGYEEEEEEEEEEEDLENKVYEEVEEYKRLGGACQEKGEEFEERGEAHLAKGEYVKAIEYYGNALDLDHDDQETQQGWVKAKGSFHNMYTADEIIDEVTLYDGYGFRTDGKPGHRFR